MLEEKLDALTKEIVALRKAVEAGGTVGAAAPVANKPAAAKPAAVKPKKVEPTHDEDEVGTAMRTLAAQSAEDKKAVRAYIKDVGCVDLAELLTKPDLYDAAFDWASPQIAGDEADDDDDV